MNPQTQEEILTRRAILARERLLAVVDELDRKRHAAARPLQLAAQVSKQPLPRALLGAAALVAIGAIGFVVASRRTRRRQRRMLMKPRSPAPSFWREVANRTAKALTAFVLIETGKKAIREALRAKQLARSPAQG